MIRRPAGRGEAQVRGLPARPARILITVLSVTLALLTGTGVWITFQSRDAQAKADDRQAVLLAAGTHAKNLISLDYRTVDADLKRILDTCTGGARTGYEAIADKLKSTTVANKVVQNGVLRATGLVSLSGGSAKALVVADAEIHWDGSKSAPQERFYRWTMELTKVGGVWLVSKVVQVM
jgi:Mce-associated membrane protein